MSYTVLSAESRNCKSMLASTS